MNIGVVSVSFLLLVVSLAAQADHPPGSARDWLMKMAEAVKTLNYEGFFVYAHNDQLEAMHIIHAADESGERERLVSLNGSAREILRDNNLLTCILPDSQSVVVEKSRPRKYVPEALLGDTRQLEEYYHFLVGGRDRMAGRPARIVAVQPRDQYRYGYRLWLDEEAGMLLKADFVDLQGKVIEQIMFVHLELLDRVEPESLVPAISGEGFKRYQAEAGPVPAESGEEFRSDWQVTRLPAGFRLQMHTHQLMPHGPEAIEHLMLSDGLATVSIFIEKVEGITERFDGLSTMGAVNAYGISRGDYQITAVGEVPAATVRLIAESVRQAEENGP